MYCINADGTSEEIWTEETNTTYEYIISGDGIHLFKQSIKSYNADEENILVFDQKSGVSDVFLSPTGTCTYHGDGYFSLMSGVLYKLRFDASKGTVVEATIDRALKMVATNTEI